MGSQALAELASNEKSAIVRIAAIRGLAAIDMKGAAARAAEILSSSNQLDDPGTIISAFLSRQDGGKALAAALKDKKLAPDRAALTKIAPYTSDEDTEEDHEGRYRKPDR